MGEHARGELRGSSWSSTVCCHATGGLATGLFGGVGRGLGDASEHSRSGHPSVSPSTVMVRSRARAIIEVAETMRAVPTNRARVISTCCASWAVKPSSAPGLK